MYAPTKVWRHWYRRVNINQRRYAMCSVLAASSLPALVMAKGHKIEKVPEIPLVVENKVQSFKKTKDAVQLLHRLSVWDDIVKVKKTKRLRAGKGKMRNRRFKMKRGPCVVYERDEGITRAFRNIPGVTLLPVQKLNMLKLAPGGHVGRMIIWTEGAIKRLDRIYGTWKQKSKEKADYNLPMPKMTCTDLGKLLRSDEIRSAIRPRLAKKPRRMTKKNPLKHLRVMLELNPAAGALRKAAQVQAEKRQKQ